MKKEYRTMDRKSNSKIGEVAEGVVQLVIPLPIAEIMLMIAGGGDELQGIKKGVLEVADAIVINKADGDNVVPAESAQRERVKSRRSLSWSSDVSLFVFIFDVF